MRLSKFFIAIFLVTVLSLVYIDLQVQIYSLGYQGEGKKTELQKLRDYHSDVSLNIYKLKSSNNLGVRLLSDNSKMKFLDQRNIVKLEAPLELAAQPALATARISGSTKPNLLARMFSLRSQAEAEPVK